MKVLEQWTARGRALARRARARIPGSASALRPERLVLRLDDHSPMPNALARAGGAPLQLGEWRDAVLKVQHWLGPVRVTVVSGAPASSRHLEKMVHFANRLECPTQLVAAGPVPKDLAEALVDRGLAAVTVKVASVDDSTQKRLAGADLGEVQGTLRAFQEMRVSRRRPLALVVAVPLLAENGAGIGAVAAWARQEGADAVMGYVPAGLPAPPDLEAARAALGRDDATPGHRAGLRAEILSDGSFYVSSLLDCIGQVRDAEPRALWEAADAVVQAARVHENPWDLLEQVPEGLKSVR